MRHFMEPLAPPSLSSIGNLGEMFSDDPVYGKIPARSDNQTHNLRIMTPMYLQTDLHWPLPN